MTRADSTEEDDAADEAPPLVIRGGNIHIGNGSVLRRATVVVEDGKITAVGHDLEEPDGAKVVDATGKVVSPGFVIPIARGFGMGYRVSEGFENELNPFDVQIKMGLAAGITSVHAYGGGGSTTPSGYSRLVKLVPGSLEGMTAGPQGRVVSMRVPLSPQDFRNLRKLVRETREYLEKKDEAAEEGDGDDKSDKADKAEAEQKQRRQGGRGRGGGNGKDGPKPPRNSEGLIEVLEGNARLWISGRGSMDVNELRQALEVADLLGVGVVLEGATTAWAHAGDIARTNSMAIVNPREQVERDPARPETTGSNIATAAILHDVGVPVAVTCPSGRFGGASIGTNGLMGSDLNTPHIDAAFAVRGGMPNRAALRTLTLDSAKILGVEDRVGSIEVGKDADILLLDGDPLHYKTLVQTAIVNGKIVYEKDKEPFYSHIKR